MRQTFAASGGPRAWLAAVLLVGLAPQVARAGQDPEPEAPTRESRRQRELAQAEERFAAANAERDRRHAELVEAYRAARLWMSGVEEAPAEPPEPVQAWFEAEGVARGDREGVRLEHAERPFHELWNQELHRHARAARLYSRAVEELEEAFLALEKLRNPARFARGAEETPPGMTLVPAGRYSFPASTGYLLGYPALQEPREVRLDSFYLDKREVSCTDYAAFLAAQPVALRQEHLPAAWELDEADRARYPPGWEQRPVTGVDWLDARAYAQWAGKRLPTEDEWQAAAAGLAGRSYPMGDSFLAAQVNCRARGIGEPRAPSEFPSDNTRLGLLAMSGNVREWCADLYDETSGRRRARSARRADAETMAVVKGGSFVDRPEACTTHYRWLFRARGTRLEHLGFRCARDLR